MLFRSVSLALVGYLASWFVGCIFLCVVAGISGWCISLSRDSLSCFSLFLFLSSFSSVFLLSLTLSIFFLLSGSSLSLSLRFPFHSDSLSFSFFFFIYILVGILFIHSKKHSLSSVPCPCGLVVEDSCLIGELLLYTMIVYDRGSPFDPLSCWIWGDFSISVSGFFLLPVRSFLFRSLLFPRTLFFLLFPFETGSFPCLVFFLW